MRGYTIMADAFTLSALPETSFGLRILSNPELSPPEQGGLAMLQAIPTREMTGPCGAGRCGELFRGGREKCEWCCH